LLGDSSTGRLEAALDGGGGGSGGGGDVSGWSPSSIVAPESTLRRSLSPSLLLLSLSLLSSSASASAAAVASSWRSLSTELSFKPQT
jgi:hypothetical protein